MSELRPAAGLPADGRDAGGLLVPDPAVTRPSTVSTEPAVLELTRRLVAAPSQNPGEDERSVAAVVEAICAELGLPVPQRVGEPTRPNQLIELSFGSSGGRLLLCGHLDTKPVGEGRWSTPPLTASQVGDELRGRGVVDMKGAIAAMLLSAADLAADPPPRGSLLLALVADEEDGARFGGRWLAENHPLTADAAVIGEPGGLFDDWDRLHLGSRGICNFDIEVTTDQGHSSLRDVFGMVSATEVAARLIVAIRDEFTPPCPEDQPWRPTLTPGVVIEGGINYGVLPGFARVRSECRLVSGMTENEFVAALKAFVAARVPDGAEVAVTVRDWIDATRIESDHAVAVAARDALEHVVGVVPADDVFPATTDATWLAAMGVPTLPALGPGLLRHAHAVDERVGMVALRQARDLYTHLARRFCELGS